MHTADVIEDATFEVGNDGVYVRLTGDFSDTCNGYLEGGYRDGQIFLKIGNPHLFAQRLNAMLYG